MFVLYNSVGLHDSHCDYPVYFMLDLLYYCFVGGDGVGVVVGLPVVLWSQLVVLRLWCWW